MPLQSRRAVEPDAASGNGSQRPGGWIPGLSVLREYQLGWLRNDIVAGIVLSTMLVPVGIAYAVASGVPAIYGLYATIVPLIAYAHVRAEPDPRPRAGFVARTHHPRRRPALVRRRSRRGPSRSPSAMAVVAGAVCILAGVARLGFITELLSKPIRYGYMNGIALAVLISQLPKLFGFSIESTGPLRDLGRSARRFSQDKANWAGTALGVGTLVADPRAQGSQAHGRNPGRGRRRDAGRRLVRPVGALRRQGARSCPAGPAGLRDPVASSERPVPILAGGVAVAIVAFADTSVLSRTYAARTGTRVDPNQEMVGLGAANLAAGLFQGFPISSSSSRTPVAEAAGAKTQMTGVVGALIVALVIVAAPNLFKDLPYAALAAVVIAAAIGLFEFKDLARIYRIQNWEFWLSILCTAGVAIFGAIPGIGIAILLAVIEFLWDGWRPHWAVLGKPEGVDGYHDMARYPAREEDSGPGPVPLGRTFVLRQRGAVQPARSRRDRGIAHAGSPRGRRCGADHQCRRDLRRRPDRTRPDARRPGTSSFASPN